MTEPFRVYLAEDDPDDQYLLQLAFKESPVEVSLHCYENGKLLYEALRELSGDQEWPHLILLDLNLPVWDGKRTLDILKKHVQLKSIPVVVYTTSRLQADVNEVYDLGANSYIVKPAKYESLVETIGVLTHYWFRLVKFSRTDKSVLT